MLTSTRDFSYGGYSRHNFDTSTAPLEQTAGYNTQTNIRGDNGITFPQTTTSRPIYESTEDARRNAGTTEDIRRRGGGSAQQGSTYGYPVAEGVDVNNRSSDRETDNPDEEYYDDEEQEGGDADDHGGDEHTDGDDTGNRRRKVDEEEEEEDDDISPLEQKVLDEYTQVLKNLNTLSSTIASLTLQSSEFVTSAVTAGGFSNPDSTTSAIPATAEILDKLRILDRKSALVFTALKSSVYRIVLQQEMMGEQEEQDQQQGLGYGYEYDHGYGYDNGGDGGGDYDDAVDGGENGGSKGEGGTTTTAGPGAGTEEDRFFAPRVAAAAAAAANSKSRSTRGRY